MNKPAPENKSQSIEPDSADQIEYVTSDGVRITIRVGLDAARTSTTPNEQPMST